MGGSKRTRQNKLASTASTKNGKKKDSPKTCLKTLGKRRRQRKVQKRKIVPKKVNNLKAYVCKLCWKIFKTGVGLQRHRWLHTHFRGSESEERKCKFCELSCDNPWMLIQHLTSCPIVVTEKKHRHLNLCSTMDKKCSRWCKKSESTPTESKQKNCSPSLPKPDLSTRSDHHKSADVRESEVKSEHWKKKIIYTERLSMDAAKPKYTEQNLLVFCTQSKQGQGIITASVALCQRKLVPPNV